MILVSIFIFSVLIQFLVSRYHTLVNSLSHRHSWKLRKISRLTLISCIHLLVHHFLIISFFIGLLLFPSLQHDLSYFFVRQGVLRFSELTHTVIHLYMLTSPDLTVLPLPLKTKNLSSQWLTSVLHETGMIPSTTQVSSFTSQTLTGGCHFQVSKVSLTYSSSAPSDLPASPLPQDATAPFYAPATLVVKILSWDKGVVERIWLYFLKVIGFPGMPAFIYDH